MKPLDARSKRLSLLAVAVLVIAGCGLLTAQSWLALMTVARLFAISEGLEHPPAENRVGLKQQLR